MASRAPDWRDSIKRGIHRTGTLAGALGLIALALALTLACGPALAAPASGGDTPSPAGTVQVQDGDMASVLAFRLKPRGATIEQMMLALQRLNPDAFIQGNVNLLRDGAVLRLPSADDVFSLSPEQARDKVRGQHMAFLGALELPAGQQADPDLGVQVVEQAQQGLDLL